MKLIIDNLEKKFNDKHVIKGASYIFEENKIYGLLGRNGAGKTTLFNILYKELKNDGGEVYIDDEGEKRDIDVVDVGMVFSENFLPDFLTGYEFIKFIIDLNKDKKNLPIDEYFSMMDIDEFDRHKLIKTYSHGMKSKLSLLVIYIKNPKILLLDEPLTSVDVVSGAEIKKMFKFMKNNHILIISTHMLELAKEICDEIVLLNDGKLYSLENLMRDEDFEEKIVEALKEKKDA